MNIRQAEQAEYHEIDALLRQAFSGSSEEAVLVEKLRSTGAWIREWVLSEDDTILGYIAYTKAFSDSGVHIGSHLAPVAVLPLYQGRGYGTRLITTTLAEISARGLPVYVLGDPSYYSRFGFALARGQSCEFDPRGTYFQVLSDAQLPPRAVKYEDAFYGK